MIWGEIYYKRHILIYRIQGNMESVYYYEIWENGLLSDENDALGDRWTLLNDSDSFHL